MQIAVDERLRVGEELIFARLRRGLEDRVGLERALVGVEMRTGPAVERRLAIGIGEDQILGDAAELDIAREQLEAALVLGRRRGEHRGIEQRFGEKFGDVGGEARIFYPADQALAHDDVRRKVFHDDHRLLAVEMEYLRHQARRVTRLFDERVVLEPRSLERQRPGFADEAHIGQRLLDDETAGQVPRQ